jgi:hypothetical protein
MSFKITLVASYQNHPASPRSKAGGHKKVLFLGNST